MSEIKRQIPNGVNEGEILSNIEEIEKLFGMEWLEEHIYKNILKQLWNRQDILATIELNFLGYAIKKNNLEINREWIIDFIHQVKTNKIHQIIGAVQEIIIATFFENKLSLAKPNQHGYDLEILLPRQTIKLSIKKLQSSDIERKNDREFKDLEKYYIRKLTRNKINGMSLLLYTFKADSYSNKKIIRMINKIIKLKKENKNILAYDDYIVKMGNISCDNSNFGLNPHKISYQLNLIYPHKNDEQQRFIRLFKSAYKNINTFEASTDKINALSISLPTSISIEKASQWLENEFKRGKFHGVSFVILLKNVVASDKNSSFLGTSIEFILNNNAKHLYNFTQGALKMSLPIGVMMNGDLNYSIVNDTNSIIEIKDAYTYQAGFKSCIHIHGDIKFDINSIYNLTQEFTFTPPGSEKSVTITPIRADSDNLTLL